MSDNEAMVEKVARVIFAHEEVVPVGDELHCAVCGEVIDGGDLDLDQASHQARAVLSAVGYADLLAEVDVAGTLAHERKIERDALAATVARVEALVTGSFDPERSDVTVAAIRAALHPEKGTDDE